MKFILDDQEQLVVYDCLQTELKRLDNLKENDGIWWRKQHIKHILKRIKTENPALQ